MLNKEQILELCLREVSRNEDAIDDFPGEFIVLYVLESKFVDVENFTDEQVLDEVNKLVVDFELRNLSKKGLIDVSIDDTGEFSYYATDLGKAVLERMREEDV